MLKKEFTTPPMGWNSYDYYDTTVTEDQIIANAKYMAQHLKETGYEYIVVDIQWYAPDAGKRRDEHQYIPFNTLTMDKYSRLIPCPKRFPSSANGKGFKPLADYIHKLGLKFGIHIMRGIPRQAAHMNTSIKGSPLTANEIADPSSISKWNPDMYGIKNTTEGQLYYQSLIDLYASWGVDFIKCDDIANTNLYTDNYSAKHEIEMLYNAIENVDQEIVLSLSPGPALIEKAWHYNKHANMWRITDDFWDQWDLLLNMFDRCEVWEKHVVSGGYPDCDMLPLGKIGHGFGHERTTHFTKDEQITMMSLWSLFRSPMMVGSDLTQLDDWTLNLLNNPTVASLLHENWCARQYMKDESQAIWVSKNKETGQSCIGLFNLSETTKEVVFTHETLENTATKSGRELWTNTPISLSDQQVKCLVPAHGARLILI